MTTIIKTEIIKIQNEVFKDLIAISEKRNEKCFMPFDSKNYTENEKAKRKLIDALEDYHNPDYEKTVRTALHHMYCDEYGQGIYAYLAERDNLANQYENYKPFMWQMNHLISDTLITLVKPW